jgi:hypothetical protein
MAGMREFAIVFVHLIVTLARLARPGGLRSVVAKSVLVRHQLLILNRGCKRAPNLRATDRIIAGLRTLFMRPARVLRSAIVVKPSTLLPQCAAPAKVPHVVFAQAPPSAWPEGTQQGPHQGVVAMKRRNRGWGCPPHCAADLVGFSVWRSISTLSAVCCAFISDRNRIRKVPPGLRFSVTRRIVCGAAIYSDVNRQRCEPTEPRVSRRILFWTTADRHRTHAVLEGRAPAGTDCGRNGITNWSRFVPVAEALSRLVPNSDSRLIPLIRHAQA